MIATSFCMFELYDAFRKKGMKPIQWLCVAYPAALLGAYTLGRQIGHSESLMMPVLLMFSMGRWWSWSRARRPTSHRCRHDVHDDIPGLMLSLVYPLIDLEPHGLSTLALTLSMTIAFMGDIAAYCVGIRWGRHRLCPNISPRKTVEGAVAGLAARWRGRLRRRCSRGSS